MSNEQSTQTHTTASAAQAIEALIPLEEGQELDTQAQGSEEFDGNQAEQADIEAEYDDQGEDSDEAENALDDDSDSLEEDESEADDDEEPQEEALFTVEIDGEQVTVSLEEARDGYMRQKDYTRKTQDLAKQRKEAEAELQALNAKTAQYAQVLEALNQQLTIQEPDWEQLRQEDPQEYQRAWIDYQVQREKQQAISAESRRVKAEMEQAAIAKMSNHLSAERERILERVPQWKDKAVAKRESEMIKTSVQEVGYTPEEAEQIYDHRFVLLARKAALYDQIQKRKSEVKDTKRKSVAKPGGSKTSTPTAAKKAQAQFAKTRKVSDAARAIEFLI